MNRLRRKLEYLGLANVKLLEHDAADINLPDASVDVVASNLGINNFENADAVMQSLFRVVKPEAGLYLTTNLCGHMAEFYEVFHATLIETGQNDRLAVLEDHVQHRGTIDSVSSMLDKAGFSVEDAETNSFQMRFADGSSLLRHYFIRLGFVQGWKSIVTGDLQQTTFEALVRNLNIVASERGELALTIPMAYFEARKYASGQ